MQQPLQQADLLLALHAGTQSGGVRGPFYGGQHPDTIPYHRARAHAIRYRITIQRAGMHTDDDGSERWIEAGLAELAEGGIDRVRVEVVAGRLGVTKGGFYRRFKDRAALLNAMLDNWSRGRIAVVHQQTALAGLPPRERLKAIVKLYSERVNAQGMAVELAIRQWARSDKLAAASVAQVDAARLKNVAQLYRKLGFTGEKQCSVPWSQNRPPPGRGLPTTRHRLLSACWVAPSARSAIYSGSGILAST